MENQIVTQQKITSPAPYFALGMLNIVIGTLELAVAFWHASRGNQFTVTSLSIFLLMAAATALFGAWTNFRRASGRKVFAR